jgi:hypothetical protein
MALQVGKDVFGIAKQTAKGSIASNPYFAIGLAGGGLSIAPSQEPDALTSAYLSPAGAYRDKIESGASIETRAYLKSIGLLLLGALGGISTTGSGPYTHVITLGTALLYLTAFQKKGDDTLHAVKDCKIDELAISWEENSPLKVSAKMVGGAWSVPATFTPTANEMDTTDYFTPVGGTFRYDVDGSTLATLPILGGSVTIKRSAEAQYFSGAIEAGDVFEGACAVDVGLTVMPDDMTLWKNILTGAVGGTSISGVPIYGSYSCGFVNGAASLTLAGANTAFLCDMPEADPAGGGAKMELAGIGYRSAGTPITATLVNTQATY